ncbi:unnamed protein product [Strongylus vulgaris]|uniref:Uncharacterized protein n=2 Tax=Strongylus vulgaris TaxID=40348 RepID=A0A3P7LHQ9_STRVU|nr:unnamed protein product [Strongylus vulgaris]
MFCMNCCACLQFAMVAERYVALWKCNTYEAFGKLLGMAFAAISVAVAFAATAWVVRREEYTEAAPYCTASSPPALKRISILGFTLCSANVATLLSVAILFITNQIAIKRLNFVVVIV